MLKTGNPESVLVRVHKTDNCWIWTGQKNIYGYGYFVTGHSREGTKKVVMAHRWVYQHLRGAIPAGLELDHLCRNTLCCNPDHLEPVTHAENIRRGLWGQHHKSKTHCKQGHEFSGFNVIRRTHKLGGPARQCRACLYESIRRYKASKKAQSIT